MNIGVIIALGLLAVVVLWAIVTYNRLVGQRMAVRSDWASIDVQLKRRYDLIPNLVETVRGYAAHEKETLQGVIAARNQAVAARSPGEVAAAEGMLGGALRQLFAIAEAYPDLKANQNFLQLQQELAATESAVGGARMGYNRSVEAYNTSIAQVPTVIIASLFGFRDEEFFELTDAAQREAPRVKFT